MMSRMDVLRLLHAAGYYKGILVDSYDDTALNSIHSILSRHNGMLTKTHPSWSRDRRGIAAAQLILHFAGYEPGVIDGLAGHNTYNAFTVWQNTQTYGVEETQKLFEPTQVAKIDGPGFKDVPTQAQCPAYYGSSKAEIQSHLVMVDFPYPMILDYDEDEVSTRAQVHEKAAPSFLAALNHVLAHYGYETIVRLGLNRNAGTFNYRNMRGSKKLSMHAYGCAWDVNAKPNGLTTRCPDALFCRPEYKAFLDIFESHGWLSLGRAIGRDYMHFQRAKL